MTGRAIGTADTFDPPPVDPPTPPLDNGAYNSDYNNDF